MSKRGYVLSKVGTFCTIVNELNQSFFTKGNFGDTKEPWQSKWKESILVQYHPLQCAILKVETQMSSTSGWYKIMGNATEWEPGVPVYKHETKDVYIYRSKGGDWKIGEKQDLRVYSSKDSAFLRGVSYLAIHLTTVNLLFVPAI